MDKYSNDYYFLRHADTDRSKDVHFSEHELSVKGKKQASLISDLMEKESFDYIFCSPFERARQTIEPYIKKSGKELTIEDKLSGRIINDLPENEVWIFFEKSWNDYDYSAFSAESANDCIRRVESFIARLERELFGQKILLVSHSNPIALFLSKFDKSINYKWFRKMKTPALYRFGLGGEIIEIDICKSQ